MSVSQLSVFVENKTGKLVEITDVLSRDKIDIRAMSIADTRDFGILRMIVSDTDKAKAALEESGFIVSVTQVIGVAVTDQPGSLTNVVRLLADNGVNVEYMYAFITVSKQYAYVVLRVEDNDRAASLLTENGVILVSEKDIRAI